MITWNCQPGFHVFLGDKVIQPQSEAQENWKLPTIMQLWYLLFFLLAWVFQKCRDENIEVSPVCSGGFSKLRSGCEHHHDCSSSLPKRYMKTPFVTWRYPSILPTCSCQSSTFTSWKKIRWKFVFFKKYPAKKRRCFSSYQSFCHKTKKQRRRLRVWSSTNGGPELPTVFCSIHGTNHIFTY